MNCNCMISGYILIDKELCKLQKPADTKLSDTKSAGYAERKNTWYIYESF